MTKYCDFSQIFMFVFAKMCPPLPTVHKLPNLVPCHVMSPVYFPVGEAEGDFQYHGRQNPLPSLAKILQSRSSKLDKMAREVITKMGRKERKIIPYES